MIRRAFFKHSAWALTMVYSHGFVRLRKSKQLKILVLGGTNFVGPAVVQAALRAGHDVTLLNRGVSNPELFSNLRLIKADREIGLSAYDAPAGEKWDLVIDVWPEKSKMVDEATKALAPVSGHYIFISSIAVYQNFHEVGITEDSATIELPHSKTNWGYAEEKLASEQFVRRRFAENHTILRPGPIKGWRDPALDLAYWCTRLKLGEPLIAPGSGQDFLQFIDVNDVGRFSIMAGEEAHISTFNLVGPPFKLTWSDFLTMAKKHFDSKSDLVWIEEGFLRKHSVRSFSDLPLWAPLSEDRGFMQISGRKLQSTGFEWSLIEETLTDCLGWLEESKQVNIAFGVEGNAIGLSEEREQQLIRAWGEFNDN